MYHLLHLPLFHTFLQPWAHPRQSQVRYHNLSSPPLPHTCGSQPGAILPPTQGTGENNWRHTGGHNWQRECYWHVVCASQEVTDAPKHPTAHRPAAQQRITQHRTANGSENEKLCSVPLCASLVAQMLKNSPAMQETWVQSLGWEDPLEKGLATHSSILAWRIPWTEKPGMLPVHGVAKSQTGLSN